MADLVIRPTMKFIYLGYATVAAIFVVWIGALLHLQWSPQIPSIWRFGITWVPLLLFLWPLKRHLRNRLTKTTIQDFQIKHETGLFTKTTRTIMLPRVQDVTVQQRFFQRIFNVGDVSIETAGETGRLTIFHIDRPQEIADRINQLSQTQYPTDSRA